MPYVRIAPMATAGTLATVGTEASSLGDGKVNAIAVTKITSKSATPIMGSRVTNLLRISFSLIPGSSFGLPIYHFCVMVLTITPLRTDSIRKAENKNAKKDEEAPLMAQADCHNRSKHWQELNFHA